MTILEVLVVMVILLLGIYSAIRLFPVGFSVMNSSENAAMATRLGQVVLGSLKTGQGVPEGVYVSYVDSSGNTWFDPTQVPNDMTNFSSPNQSARLNALMTDMNKWHYVDRETFTVPPVATGNSYPVWNLKFAPILIPSAAAAGNTVGKYITGISGDWTQIAGSSSTDPNAVPAQPVTNPDDYLSTGGPVYLVDYAAGKLALPSVAYAQQIHVSVVDQASGTRQEIDLTIPASAPDDWFDRATYAALPAGPWVSGSARVYRTFTYTGSTTFSNDPYEFTLINPNIGSSSTSDANIGSLAFNPLAASAAFGKPVVAKISYSVYDWHILHEDRDVSAGDTIRTTIRGLKKAGDVDIDKSVFTGLFANENDGNNNHELLLVNMDTGTPVGTGQGTINDVADADEGTPAPSGATNPLDVSFINGRITLPSNFNVKHVRVFYAARLDWGACVQMTPTTFLPTTGSVRAVNQTVPSVYTIPTGTATIEFPPDDAGKQVVLTGVTYTNASNQKVTVPQVNLTLPSTIDYASMTVAVDLSTAGSDVTNGVSFAGIDPTKGITVQSISGVSMRALVIWREHGAWRRRTLETSLTPTA